MSAAHVSSSFLHRLLSGLRAAVFLQDPVSVPPSCTPARVGRPQAITSPEPVPPRSASHHRSRRRRDRAADVEPARAVNLWLSFRAVMFSPCRCPRSHDSQIPTPAGPRRATAPVWHFAEHFGRDPLSSDLEWCHTPEHMRAGSLETQRIPRSPGRANPRRVQGADPDFIITTRPLFGL
jgi:hypothetical protein